MTEEQGCQEAESTATKPHIYNRRGSKYKRQGEATVKILLINSHPWYFNWIQLFWNYLLDICFCVGRQTSSISFLNCNKHMIKHYEPFFTQSIFYKTTGCPLREKQMMKQLRKRQLIFSVHFPLYFTLTHWSTLKVGELDPEDQRIISAHRSVLFQRVVGK